MKLVRKAISVILVMVVCMASLSGCAEKIETVEGITVVSATMGKPAQGEIVYVPSDAAGFFAVDGTLGGQRTIRLCVEPDGILYFDLSLDLASALEADAEIRVFKGGNQLVSYAENGVSLPAGNTEINARVDTGEDAPCSGAYTVRFYIDGRLVNETTGTV